MPTSSQRFFRNYTYSLLSLKIDRRGLTVTNSRLGYAKLGPGTGFVDALAGFTSIGLGMACQKVDGAFLDPQVSSLNLTSTNAALFNAYDGERITLTYNGSTLFDGYVETSTISVAVDIEARKEVAQVKLTCRSFDASTYQVPIVLGTTTVYGTPENPGNNVVPGRSAETIYARARAISGEAISSEDTTASAYTDELVGQITSDEQDTNQGALLTAMAQRAGVLVDLTKVTPSWRSYQGVPAWRITDADVVTFELETDQESPGALVYERKEDSSDRIGYSASGTNPIERTVSTADTVNWGLAHAAAVTPLRKTKALYLSKFSMGFNAGVPLVSRLPLKVTFQRGSSTYRGAVVGMTHSITPDSWRLSCDVEPVHLVTRVSDVIPTTVQHFRASSGAGTFTVAWTGRAKVCTATAAGTTTTLKTTDAEALDVSVGDQVQVRTSTGALKDQRVFTVVTETSASGTTTVTLDAALSAATAVGDYLTLVDFGVEVPTWTVYFRTGGASQVSPVDSSAANNTVVRVTSPTFTATGLAAGTYAVTVVANTPDGFRSAPSPRTQITVT